MKNYYEKMILQWILLLTSVAAVADAFASSSSSDTTQTLPFRSHFTTTIRSAKTSNNINDDNIVVDANRYNVPLEEAAELWTVSVAQEQSLDRPAGIPYLDTLSKDHFVDDVSLMLSRKGGGGMGMQLLELAGGREDGVGLTIVKAVSGNALQAGVLPGDAMASISSTESILKGTSVSETRQVWNCECQDFDTTLETLSSIPSHIENLQLNMKRIRKWPKIKVTVEYPPIQCAEGVDNTVDIELFAGENLKRGLQNRGIVLEDRMANKCDFCGGKCTVKIMTQDAMALMNPMSMTEEKLLKRNPNCRVRSLYIGYGYIINFYVYLLPSSLCSSSQHSIVILQDSCWI